MNNPVTAIELFSGCGGFSYGFQQAGIQVLVGVDNEASSLKTFEKNHSASKGLLIDLFDSQAIEQILDQTGTNSIDIIIGGPPCQGFSLTGTRNESDKRNKLFYTVFDLARKVKPKAIVIENVPGIVRLYKGKAKEEIYRLCDELGYNCVHQELFAPDYGIPQIRKRVFFVAIRKKFGVFEFPKPTHNKESYLSCEEAIGDLPSLESDHGSEKMEYKSKPYAKYQITMRNGSDVLYNHLGTNHTEHVINVISQVPEGGNHKDLPPGVGTSRKFNEAWTRYHSQQPSKTIDTGHRNHFHYKWHRVPTVRENARLQSFPDSFVFYGTKTQQNRQVGNAVPPLLGKIIGTHLLKYIT
ncbi:DNA cytosine methyltransferase [bacterium AH-315-C07]|nr:DNA cytosine methyltransferase [bacterium AH-315-C07]